MQFGGPASQLIFYNAGTIYLYNVNFTAASGQAPGETDISGTGLVVGSAPGYTVNLLAPIDVDSSLSTDGAFYIGYADGTGISTTHMSGAGAIKAESGGVVWVYGSALQASTPIDNANASVYLDAAGGSVNFNDPGPYKQTVGVGVVNDNSGTTTFYNGSWDITGVTPHEDGIEINGGILNLGAPSSSGPITINTGTVGQTGGTLSVYCGIQWNATGTLLQNGYWYFDGIYNFSSESSITLLGGETLGMWIDPSMNFSSEIFMEPGPPLP